MHTVITPAVLDAIPMQVVLLDADGRIRYRNAAWRAHSERAVSPYHALGDGASYVDGIDALREALGDEDRRALATGVRALLLGESGFFEHEYEGPLAAGPRRVHVRAIASEHAGIRHVFVAHEDVTERLRLAAERDALRRQLAAGRGLLEAVLRQMPAAVAVVEAPGGRLLVANEQTEIMLGASVAGIREVADLGKYHGLHADGSPFLAGDWPVARVLATGETIENERIEYVRGDGARRVMRCNAGPVRGDGGAMVAAVVVCTDVTEEEATAARVAASERQLAEAQRVARIGSWEYDAASGEIHWSDEMYRIYGYEPRTVAPWNREEFLAQIHPDDRAAALEAMDVVLPATGAYEMRHRARRADGRWITVHSRARVIADQPWSARRLLGTVQLVREEPDGPA